MPSFDGWSAGWPDQRICPLSMSCWSVARSKPEALLGIGQAVEDLGDGEPLGHREATAPRSAPGPRRATSIDVGDGAVVASS